MAQKKTWRNIEEWIAEKAKKNDVSFLSPKYRKLIVRENSALDYQVFLEEASRSMIRFKKPEHLIRMIVKTIDEHVRTTHTAMLVYSNKKNCFLLVDSKGTAGNKIPMGFIKLDTDNPLIRFFDNRLNFIVSAMGAVDYEVLDDIVKGKEDISRQGEVIELVPSLLKQMELLKVNICLPLYYKKSLLGVFLLGNKLSGKKFSRQEIGFFTTLANDVAMALANTNLIQDLQAKIEEVNLLYEREHNMFIHTAISLAAAIDARDPYTHGHTERVTQYALAVADELEELPEALEYTNFRETLNISALLHDVGKIGVPDSILNKTGKLSSEEYEKIREHPITGATILYPIKALAAVAAEVRAHHERYDGTGYPDGLKGEEIPFIARVIAVTDTFDAIISDRPYRQKKMEEVAVQRIKDNSGTQFDPIVVSAFLLSHRKGKLAAVD